jgi:hypothetical protein
MKWTYGIRNKMTAAILLFSVLAIVLLNNWYERHVSEKISAAISTIYDDRLVPESYLLQYSDYMHQVVEISEEPEHNVADKQRLIAVALTKLEMINEDYRKTKLTAEEAEGFRRFTGLTTGIAQKSLNAQFEDCRHDAREALTVLRQLSKIQVAEAKQQMLNAEKLYASGSIFSHLEMVVLIVLGIIIQGLVFASKTLTMKEPVKQNLN